MARIRSRRRRAGNVGRSLFILFAVLATGTIGYTLIEHDVSFFDALYMTVITISTVGFGEIEGITAASRPLTTFIIVSGIGLLSYVLFIISQAVVEGQFQKYLGRRSLDKHISKLKNHVILCGYGRVGEVIAQELRRYGKDFVVVEQIPEKAETFELNGYLFVIGDATADEVLLEAQVDRASSLIAATYPDAQNVFITLTARELNPSLRIISRAYTDEAEKRLLRAGADQVIYPDRMGGMRMVFSLLRPGFMNFLDVLGSSYEQGHVEVDELTVGEECPFRGRTLREAQFRQQFDLIVLAVRKSDGALRFNPGADTQIDKGDTLIAIGKREDLDAFGRRVKALEKMS